MTTDRVGREEMPIGWKEVWFHGNRTAVDIRIQRDSPIGESQKGVWLQIVKNLPFGVSGNRLNLLHKAFHTQDGGFQFAIGTFNGLLAQDASRLIEQIAEGVDKNTNNEGQQEKANLRRERILGIMYRIREFHFRRMICLQIFL